MSGQTELTMAAAVEQFGLLARAVLMSCSHAYGSEETFYRTTGFYRENALEVGFRMARALEELSRAATEQSADSREWHPS